MWILSDSKVAWRIMWHCEKNCNKDLGNEAFRIGNVCCIYRSRLAPLSSLQHTEKNNSLTNHILKLIKLIRGKNPHFINSLINSKKINLFNHTPTLQKNNNGNKTEDGEEEEEKNDEFKSKDKVISLKKNILIRDLNGTTKVIQINNEHIKTKQLLEKIEHITKIPKSEIRCSFQNKELNHKDKKTLKDLGIENNSYIDIKLRLVGGTPQLDQIIDKDDNIYLNYIINEHKMEFAEKMIKFGPKEFILIFDGGCDPNPGPGGAGIRIKEKGEGNVVYECSFDLGLVTSNEAKYYGLIYGLITAAKLNITHLEVYGDSELVIKQMNKQFAVKTTNIIPLHGRAEKLCNLFERISFIHQSKFKDEETNKLTSKGIKRSQDPNYVHKIDPRKKNFKDISNKLQKLSEILIDPNQVTITQAKNVTDINSELIQKFLSIIEEEVYVLCPDTGSGDNIFSENEEIARRAAEDLVLELFNFKSKMMGGKENIDAVIDKNLPIDKPVVMIINNRGIPENLKESEVNYEENYGTHWLSIVLLPQLYKGVLGNKLYEATDERQRIILFDSAQSNRPFPQTFLEVMENGYFRKYNSSDKDSTQAELYYKSPIDENSEFVIKTNRRQQYSNSCGYWAMFNSLMTILTGSHDFYDEFSIKFTFNYSDEKVDKCLQNAEWYLKDTLENFILTNSKNNGTEDNKSWNMDLPYTRSVIKNKIIKEPQERVFGKKKDGTPDLRCKENRSITPNKRKSETPLTPNLVGATAKQYKINPKNTEIEEDKVKIAIKEPLSVTNHQMDTIIEKSTSKGESPTRNDINYHPKNNCNTNSLEYNKLSEISRRILNKDIYKSNDDNFQRNVMNLLGTNNNEKTIIQYILSGFILDLDDRLRSLEQSKNTTAIQTHVNTNPCPSELTKQLNNLEKIAEAHTAQLKNIESIEKLNTENTRTSLMKQSEFYFKISSEVDDCKSRLTKQENNTQENLTKLQEDINQTLKDLKGRMEIESAQNFNDDKFQTFTDKLEKDFEKLSLNFMNDINKQKSNINKDNDLLRECQDTWKNYQTSSQNNSIEARIKTLEMNIENIRNKFNLQTKSTEILNNSNVLIEKAQQDIYNLEANLLQVAEKINYSIIPFMVDLSKTSQTLNYRIDSFWRSRGNNKYQNGEEKGFRINTDILKQELENKYKEYKNRNLKLIPVNSVSEDENLKVDISAYPGVKSQAKHKQSFRDCFREEQAYCKYSDRGNEFIIYIPKPTENKDLKSSTSDPKKGAPKESLSNYTQ